MPTSKRIWQWLSKLSIVLIATWCIGISGGHISLVRLYGRMDDTLSHADALVLEKRIDDSYSSLPRRVTLIEDAHTKILALMQQIAQDVSFLKGQAQSK